MSTENIRVAAEKLAAWMNQLPDGPMEFYKSKDDLWITWKAELLPTGEVVVRGGLMQNVQFVKANGVWFAPAMQESFTAMAKIALPIIVNNLTAPVSATAYDFVQQIGTKGMIEATKLRLTGGSDGGN